MSVSSNSAACDKTVMVTADEAISGGDHIFGVSEHVVLGSRADSISPHHRRIILGMGCFWGAERLFWKQAGVVATAVGYSAGFTKNPTYEQVCTGQTGHNEVVLVIYDPEVVSLDVLLKVFWENHDPTQGMRQGNDVGTQYRSGIYCDNEGDLDVALKSRELFAAALADSPNAVSGAQITTEVVLASEFYFAEDFHQQYLAKNPAGYCGLRANGVSCPIP